MQRTLSTARIPKPDIMMRTESQAATQAVPRGFAVCGWLVEVVMAELSPASRFFAVGIEGAEDAEEFVLIYPGIHSSDQRIARRCLSLSELADLRLGAGAVRPCGAILHPPKDKVSASAGAR